MHKQTLTPVILCGGAGSRLWPLSRSERPKPFVDLIGSKSLFELTLLRISDKKIFDDPIIVCNQAQEDLVLEACNKLNVSFRQLILEPMGRNTAAAIALASFCCQDEDNLLVMPADHLIDQTDSFVLDCQAALKCAKQGYLTTFGVKPNRIETGYGYIKQAQGLENQAHSNVFKVDQFCEKPNQETAQKFVDAGNYFWNSGLFVFNKRVFDEAIHFFEKELFEGVKTAYQQAHQKENTLYVKKSDFEKVKSISVDYAVMEKTDKAVLILASFDWDDLGDWQAVWRYQTMKQACMNEKTNISDGSAFFHKSCGNFVKADKTKVVLAGVDNLAVVETGDTVLVSKKDQSHLLKEAYSKLAEDAEVRLHTPTKATCPWGNFESITKTETYQVKEIMVNPGGKLSLQRHKHRCEHWMVLEGRATVTVGKEVKQLKPKESVFIPQGELHRLENFGKIPIKLIEVQIGDYFGEDDIERIEDVYERA